MTLRCAVLDDYQGVALRMADWETLRPDVEVEVFRTPLGQGRASQSALAGFHIVCLMRERTPMPAELIAALPDLRLIMTSGAQNVSIDVAEAARRGVVACGTAALAHPTVELTFGLLLELARGMGRESVELKGGQPWQTRVGFDLNGKTLGIVGLGRLGTSVARIAQAFGMRVIAWSPNLTEARCHEAGVEYAGRQALFAQADAVSLHLQLSASTRHVVGETELAAMKRTAWLLNTSRGELIDEAALLAVLRAGSIAGFGVDVYAQEPLPLDHELRRLPNTLITPHIGYVTEDNYRTYYGGIVAGIRAWLDGAPVRVLSAAH